ncbi:TrlF family AAA-like ATPase [Paradesertivirga mongoliensis]|uniref:TrlF family AAA-like ATPase n=1 Tax=Paradesertivirga mongoliensis TaxID=2100740 RepID=A0ABW4ZSG9_9SPHI|nr:AAA family ATPase [Pedobacter mongoliensis]
MDKGAHFHKCDFQVHSPRDINWTGSRFGVNPDQVEDLTEDQRDDIANRRAIFSKEYLQKAREKGLNAIAITDHHDIAFVKIIRAASKSENLEFIANGEPEKCITVFPGIELTLNNPICQCLLIFDSDIPDQHLDTALAMFGIVPSHEFARETAPTVRISTEQISDLNHLHKKLDDLPLLKGRYFLLPNLGNGGSSTLLRAGAQEHYKKMPCVGGYVDKSIPTNDSGWTNKLDGGDINYGNKSVGILSTSDNRFEDGREFGKYFTYLKWAEPTAEALRQACLAKQSRISQVEPQLPQIYITKLNVTNSKFLGSFSIEFNRQYNALIGGRGTGKSTVLEYLRWGLCDQVVSTTDPEDLNDLERRRKKLIDKTLSDFEGEVRITFNLNGVNHIIKRNSKSKETSLKIDGGDFQKVTEEEVRKILPIQAYSQKQLSGVGISTDELKRFIETPISTELSAFDFRLAEINKISRSEYLNLNRKKELEKEREHLNLEINSLNTQAQNLRQSLSGISDADQQVISKKEIYDLEGNIVTSIRTELNTINQKIQTLSDELKVYPQEITLTTNTENRELITELDNARRTKIGEIKELLTQVKNALSHDQILEIRDVITRWQDIKTNFDSQYEISKTNTTSNQQQLNEIQRIETRLNQLRESVNERNTKIVSLSNPEILFEEQRIAYWELHNDKLRLLNQEAKKFTELSKGLIKVEVEKCLDQNLIKSELLKTFQGTRISQEKIQSITDSIISASEPLIQWKAILDELKQLAELNATEITTLDHLPPVPKLIEAGLNETNLTRIVEILNKETWLNLATIRIEFAPEFKYTTNSEWEDVIPFSEASAGQQATALLTVLLNQPGAPLLIDQPEDDIDNRAIDDIIKNIWNAKKHRQIIFTSHNANLVVNGDAELVACFDYKDTGSQTRGLIKAEGAIDSRVVKDEITSVMEGGEKAFRLRKDKYGY